MTATTVQKSSRPQDTAALLAEVEPAVRGYCRNRLGDAAGDDAAQQTMVALWQDLESGCEVENLAAYATQFAKYRVLQSFRESARQPTPVGDLGEDWKWGQVETDPAVQLERAAEAAAREDKVAQAKARVEALVAQLPPRMAEVVRARDLAGHSNAETAEALGIKPGSVEVTRNRAMTQLRELCGVQSSNPQAKNLTREERRERQRNQARAIRAAAGVPARRRGSILERPGGLLEVTVGAGKDPATGRKVKLRESTKDPDEAQRILARLIARADEMRAEAGATGVSSAAADEGRVDVPAPRPSSWGETTTAARANTTPTAELVEQASRSVDAAVQAVQAAERGGPSAARAGGADDDRVDDSVSSSAVAGLIDEAAGRDDADGYGDDWAA